MINRREFNNAFLRLKSLSDGCKNIGIKTNHEYHLTQIGEILPEIITQLNGSVKSKK